MISRGRGTTGEEVRKARAKERKEKARAREARKEVSSSMGSAITVGNMGTNRSTAPILPRQEVRGRRGLP